MGNAQATADEEEYASFEAVDRIVGMFESLPAETKFWIRMHTFCNRISQDLEHYNEAGLIDRINDTLALHAVYFPGTGAEAAEGLPDNHPYRDWLIGWLDGMVPVS